VTHEAGRLVQFVDPDTEPEEFFGIPHAATAAGDAPLSFTHADRPGWDFTAWFGQKAASLKHAATDLCDWWIRNYESPVPVDKQALYYEAVMTDVGTIEAYAKVMFDMITEEKLRIEKDG